MRKRHFLIVFLAVGLGCLTANALADWTAAQRLTWTPGGSFAPVLAVDSSNTLHVVWSDETPGNYEVYYKKGT